MDGAMEDVVITSLAVDPPSAMLLVTDRAVRQRQRFVADARTPDGRMVAVPAVWSVDRAEALSIAATGEAETTNATGGEVLVTTRATAE